MSLLGPLVAYVPTPRSADGALAPDVLGQLVERVVAAGASGVCVLGSVGSFAYLEPATRRAVVAAAVEAAAGRVPVLAGVGALATREVLSLARDAQDAGADALLLPTTAYLPLTDDEVLGLVRDVTETADRPVWIYHNPVTTRYDFSVEALLRAAALPGVGGVKDRAPDADAVRTRAAAVLAGAPAGLEVGYSGDLLGVHGLLAGARSWHSALAGVLPGPYAAVARLAAQRDEAGTLALLAHLAPLVELVMRSGGPRAVHAVGQLLGLPVGDVPAPLRMPAPEVRAELEGALALVLDRFAAMDADAASSR
ncbi:dihydrodipicolinate synthase family protein [Cellulomonas sp. 179-A 4D5 NHS]|uniref:dihydrodipicolinate synthase family protein n=1 Tax=Cellulomonas sp. 179-A 4D5 NHS TaxID=3142378 RepID=UPI0039A343C6